MQHYQQQNEQFDDRVKEELYGLFLKVKDSPRHIAIKAEHLLIEVSNLCSKFNHDKHPDEHIEDYEHEVVTDLGWHYAAELVMPLAYAALRLKQVKSRKLRALMASMEKHYSRNSYWEAFAPSWEKGISMTAGMKVAKTLAIEKDMPPIVIKGNASINLYSSGNFIAKKIEYGKR